MVPVGPMPGSTPIKVPTSTPIRQKSRLVGVTATEKPSARLSNSSMSARPQSHRQSEREDEQRRGTDGEAGGEQQRVEDPDLAAAEGGHDDGDEGRDQETRRLDQVAKRDQGAEDKEQRPPMPARDGEAADKSAA